MVYLAFTLLFFGLFQSLLELIKDDTAKYKRTVLQILSVLYIAGFIIGSVALYVQDRESNSLINQINGLTKSLSKIDANTIKQVGSIGESIEHTKSLIKVTDSMNRNMGELLLIRDSLMNQTARINEQMIEQMKFDLKSLEEREAAINMLDGDISLIGSDSTMTYVKACIRNFGKRNAIVNAITGYFVFFDWQKKAITYLKIPNIINVGILSPSNIGEEMSLCMKSFGVSDFNSIKSLTEFGVVCLKVSYMDALEKKEKVSLLYSVWLPSSGFGIMRDWQVGIAKQWEIDATVFN